jgi:hypothetical protein
MRALLRDCRGPSFLIPRGRFSVKGQIGQLLCGRSEGAVPLSLCIDACCLLRALESSRRLAVVSRIEGASSLLM